MGIEIPYLRYVGFAGSDTGRWPKDPQHFHPNSDHQCDTGDICGDPFGFGPDACYRDASNGGGNNGKYMRDHAREWFVWLTKQLDADGYRFDAVKHFPAYVVEDVLFNAKGNNNEFFCVGEYVPNKGASDLDTWVAFTNGRCGTFDFPYREALFKIVTSGGFFDMGSLPNFQQSNRLKTVPFINNHDSFRGPFHDSDSSDELLPTINPDDPRADVAYAAAFAVDGSPVVFYEDLIVNSGEDRKKADPDKFQTRDYLINLIWAHQKLNFKDGAYKVPFRGSQDLLVLERAGKALIALNDNGIQRQSANVQTSFGPNVTLHDYNGSNANDITTDATGRVTVSVPKMSYAIWGPVGISGGFSPPKRRTTHEFQLDDDLGDASSNALGYGGKVTHSEFRTAGSIWAAANTPVKVKVYTNGERDLEIRVLKPNAANGAKSTTSGEHTITGEASNTDALELEFIASREGYYQLEARLTNADEEPTRAFVKVNYEAPRESDKF